MDELLHRAAFIARGMWQRRWIGIGVLWLVGIVAAIGVIRIPNQYLASARIFVDTQSVLKPLMSGLAVQPRVEQQIAILSRTLISRPNVEKLVRMADLDLNIKTKEDQDRTIDAMMRTLGIAGTDRDNLYTLVYRDENPEKARRVVQALVSIFVESGLGGKRKDSETARKFIEDQIRQYERKLEEAEDRVKEFKLRNLAASSGDGKDYFARLREITTVLEASKLELREAENARDALRRQIAGEEPVLLPDITADSAAGSQADAGIALEIDGRIDALKRNLDGMRLKYTEEHPDVVGAKRVIEALEEQRRQELNVRRRLMTATSPMAGPSPQVSLNSNPVYQQLKVSHAEADARVAGLSARVAEYQSRYLALRESGKLAPQIEAEFSQLNRDYAIHKRNYEALVGRREMSEMSGEMEAAAGVADFRLIEPPRVNPQPVYPNRMMLLGMAMLGALASGLAASFLASQVWATYFDARSLREATGLPVLGTVSMVLSDTLKRKERRGLVGFVTAFMAFVGCYSAGLIYIFIQTFGSA